MTEEKRERENDLEVVRSKDAPPTMSDELVALTDRELDELEDSSNNKSMIILSGILVLLLLVIGVIVYRFYALPMKIAGKWQAETVNGRFELENKGKNTTFIMKNLNGYVGVDMVFQSQFVANDMNEYFVKDTIVFLELSRDKLSEEQIASMVGDGKLLKEGVKTKEKIILSYTKEGLKANFGDQNLDNYFKYMLRDFKGLKGTSLALRNDSFAGSGMQFKRK